MSVGHELFMIIFVADSFIYFIYTIASLYNITLGYVTLRYITLHTFWRQLRSLTGCPWMGNSDPGALHAKLGDRCRRSRCACARGTGRQRAERRERRSCLLALRRRRLALQRRRRRLLPRRRLGHLPEPRVLPQGVQPAGQAGDHVDTMWPLKWPKVGKDLLALIESIIYRTSPRLWAAAWGSCQ